jgi:hypothetical protein
VSGVSSLFTEEFYARLATYMNDGAILSQWLHTYEMDTQTLASILAAVSKTFPDFMIYSSIDSDIILIARKGGAPGRFDRSVMQHPKLQPLLKKLKMTDPVLVERRAITHWSAVKPFIATYGFAANSDYFPLVDQRASKTRFTQARVEELTTLQASPIPLLQMFDAAVKPAITREELLPVTLVDHASNDAILIQDTLLGTRKPSEAPFASGSELNATLVRHWALDCPAELHFERVLPMLTYLADRMNPHLPSAEAMRVWTFLSGSRCARALKPEQRQWLELFGAVAMRDAPRMAVTGTALLDVTKGRRNESSEYALLAAVAGLTCIAEGDRARELIRVAQRHWVRSDVRQVELRYLYAQSARKSRCPGSGG